MYGLQVLGKYYTTKGFIGPITETFDNRRAMVIELLNNFESPPFTIQRLIEVLNNNFTQYNSTHKVINAIEKLLQVSAQIDSI